MLDANCLYWYSFLFLHPPPSQSVQFDVKPGVCISGASPESVSRLLGELAQYGTHYLRLSHFSLQSADKKGLVFQVCLCLRHYLCCRDCRPKNTYPAHFVFCAAQLPSSSIQIKCLFFFPHKNLFEKSVWVIEHPWPASKKTCLLVVNLPIDNWWSVKSKHFDKFRQQSLTAQSRNLRPLILCNSSQKPKSISHI